MKKQNLEITRNETENPNLIRVTETYETPRYEAKIYADCSDWCDETVNEIKEYCKIYVPKGDYKNLTSFEIDYDDLTGKTLEEDREIFQQKLDEEFGKGEYEAFVLGAYIHSGTSFSINKGGNRVCQFDSSQLGFIGVKKEDVKSVDNIAENLTAAWNGECYEYEVLDNLTGEIVEQLMTYDYKRYSDWCKEVEPKYNVDFDNAETIY